MLSKIAEVSEHASHLSYSDEVANVMAVVEVARRAAPLFLILTFVRHVMRRAPRRDVSRRMR